MEKYILKLINGKEIEIFTGPDGDLNIGAGELYGDYKAQKHYLYGVLEGLYQAGQIEFKDIYINDLAGDIFKKIGF